MKWLRTALIASAAAFVVVSPSTLLAATGAAKGPTGGNPAPSAQPEPQPGNAAPPSPSAQAQNQFTITASDSPGQSEAYFLASEHAKLGADDVVAALTYLPQHTKILIISDRSLLNGASSSLQDLNSQAVKNLFDAADKSFVGLKAKDSEFGKTLEKAPGSLQASRTGASSSSTSSAANFASIATALGSYYQYISVSGSSYQYGAETIWGDMVAAKLSRAKFNVVDASQIDVASAEFPFMKSLTQIKAEYTQSQINTIQIQRRVAEINDELSGKIKPTIDKLLLDDLLTGYQSVLDQYTTARLNGDQILNSLNTSTDPNATPTLLRLAQEEYVRSALAGDTYVLIINPRLWGAVITAKNLTSLVTGPVVKASGRANFDFTLICPKSRTVDVVDRAISIGTYIRIENVNDPLKVPVSGKPPGAIDQ